METKNLEENILMRGQLFPQDTNALDSGHTRIEPMLETRIVNRVHQCASPHQAPKPDDCTHLTARPCALHDNVRLVCARRLRLDSVHGVGILDAHMRVHLLEDPAATAGRVLLRHLARVECAPFLHHVQAKANTAHRAHRRVLWPGHSSGNEAISVVSLHARVWTISGLALCTSSLPVLTPSRLHHPELDSRCRYS